METNLMIVIPSYEPNQRLLDLIDDLNNSFNNHNILIINDGSIGYDEIFNDAKNKSNVVLLNHDKNYGKGKALKTAFSYIKELNDDFIIITADSDGQHSPDDIKKVYDYYLNHRGTLVLGGRVFDKNTPLKSKLGGGIYRNLLRLSLNKHLNDTQTGLRAFDSSLLDFMLDVKGNRFEYEMNMIDEAIVQNIEIKEINIKTIYFDQNKGTHFRPIKDFLKVSGSELSYKVPLILSLMIDYLLFIVFSNALYSLTKYVAYSSLLASVISFVLLSLYYFYSYKNKKLVLKTLIFTYLYIIINLIITLLFNNLGIEIRLIRLYTNLIILFIDLLLNYFVLFKSKFDI